MPPETLPQVNLGGGGQPPPAPQVQPQSQPQGQSLDPSVVALTKSIGKAESGGNYNAGDNTGDGAASSGAYQFTPGFLSEWAPKSGIQYQPGTKLTPAQQDEIAYNAVKTMGTTGDPAYPHLGKLTPAQIASTWNTGDPNAYLDPEYGQNNTYGSTEKYVEQVQKNYEQQIPPSSSPQNNSPSSSGPSLTDWLLGGAGALGGWLLGNAKPLAGDAIKVAGGAIGGAIGDVPGALAGEGLGSALANEIGLGGNGGTPPPPSGGTASAEPPVPSNGFNITQEGNQVEPNKIPQEDSYSKASEAMRSAIAEAMGTTQSNRVFSQSQSGQDAINTASAFGLVEPDENGTMLFNEEKRKKLLGDVGDLQDKVIAAQGGQASPMSVSNYAGNYIGRDRFSTPADRQRAAKAVQSEMSARGIPANGQMSLEDMRKAQKEHYAAAANGYKGGKTSDQILAHKALGHAYGRTIRDNMKDPELYDRTKKMEANLINSKEVGKRLNGKKAPKNNGLWESVLRQGTRAAEIYIGDKLGGPIGAIIGGLAGEHLNRKIEKKFGRNIFETKGMRAAMDILKDTKPEMYTKLVTELGKHGVKADQDKSKVPGTKKGLIKDIKKDEGKMKKGKKGLVSRNIPPKSSMPPPPENAKKGKWRVLGKDEISPAGKRFDFSPNGTKRYVWDED